PPEFHARHSARSRRYAYRVLEQDDALMERFAWRVRGVHDWERVDGATRALGRRADFRAFAAAGGPSRSTACRGRRARWRLPRGPAPRAPPGRPARPASAPPPGSQASAPDPPASRRTAIVIAAQRASPAVVSVSVVTTRVVRTDPFGGMLHDEFFERFYPPTEYRERMPSLGSGVIVDVRGLILTNEHVVRGADDIKVTLTDGRQLPAHVLGSSATYDLAVLKVEAAKLPAAPLG